MRSFLLYVVLACLPASAQIVLRINQAPPRNIAAETLSKLPRHTAVLNDHGREIKYEGPLLRDVLAEAGIDLTKGLRGKQLSSYVTALATDGYEVVYALAEFDPTVVNSDIILADKREGQPLAANEAPFRIVAPSDKRPARSVRMVREIAVVQLAQ